MKFIKIFCRLSGTILPVPWWCEIVWAEDSQGRERRLLNKAWCHPGSWWQFVRWHLFAKHWASGQVVADVVLQSLASPGEAAAATSLTSPKLQHGGEWPGPYSTYGLNVVECLLKSLFGCARWAVAQAFPLLGRAEEDCTLLIHSERGRGVLVCAHHQGSTELPWEQRCYVNLPHRFMENWQCWQGASLTGKTEVD